MTVEDADFVALQAIDVLAFILTAGPDDDGVDGLFAAEVEFPPGILLLLGVRLAAVAESPAFVAVDGQHGRAAEIDTRLLGLARAGDVDSLAEDLDLGQGQHALTAGDV